MTKEFLKKISEVRCALKVPKEQFNSFGKYKYRSCENILEAVKPICKEQGLLLNLTDELLNIGDRYYIKATATLMDIEDSSEMSASGFAREDEKKSGMDGSQITGTASSYARKYALNALLNIDDTKDADTDEYRNQSNRPTEGAARPHKHICSECGREITEVVFKSGKRYSVDEVTKNSTAMYGREICWDCLKKMTK